MTSGSANERCLLVGKSFRKLEVLAWFVSCGSSASSLTIKDLVLDQKVYRDPKRRCKSQGCKMIYNLEWRKRLVMALRRMQKASRCAGSAWQCNVSRRSGGGNFWIMVSWLLLLHNWRGSEGNLRLLWLVLTRDWERKHLCMNFEESSVKVQVSSQKRWISRGKTQVPKLSEIISTVASSKYMITPKWSKMTKADVWQIKAWGCELPSSGQTGVGSLKHKRVYREVSCGQADRGSS